MAPRPTFDLANQALGGRLLEILRKKRNQGRTFDQIAHDLDELGIQTSRETIRRWCQDHPDSAVSTLKPPKPPTPRRKAS